MTNPLSTQDDASSIWQYMPIAAYETPDVPVSQAAKKGLSQIWSIFRQKEQEAESPFEPEPDLRLLDERQLAQISPTLDWEDAGAALGEALQDWLQPDRPTHNILLLVEPPHGGHADALLALAAQRDAKIIDSPTPAQIMDDADGWLSSLPEDENIWIYPTLEKTFLRHAGGLGLVRRFLDHAASGALGRGLIGCDSWAWAYLRHVWHGNRPGAITSIAFDKERLARQFQRTLPSNQAAAYHFRQANNGYALFSTNEESNSENTSDYLQQLAAFSRGNLGVAQAIWRDSLRIKPDEALLVQQNGEEDETPSSRTIWVTAWDDLEHPTLPPNAAENNTFVLHTLLLHGGLSVELMQHLLPLAGNEVMETVYQLAEAGLVARHDASWQVTPRGYPVVRQYLNSNGYLCDTF